MYNLRYHVASLVAAFLFLSVGLLLGTIVAERGTLDTQRDTLVSSLREQFESLSAENTALSSENEIQSGYMEDTLPLLISGQLEGAYVVVISNAGRADGVSFVTDAITRAGGTPIVVTALKSQMGLTDPVVSDVATGYVDVAPQDEEAFIEAVAQIIADEWTSTGSSRPLTQALMEAEAFTTSIDLPAGESADAIVTMAAWDGVPDAAALAVARAMSLRELPATGFEMSSQHTGVAAAAVAEGLSAVEDAGTPPGDFSLVFVLAGHASGHFGPSEEAQAHFPVVDPALLNP